MWWISHEPHRTKNTPQIERGALCFMPRMLFLEKFFLCGDAEHVVYRQMILLYFIGLV